MFVDEIRAVPPNDSIRGVSSIFETRKLNNLYHPVDFYVSSMKRAVHFSSVFT